MVLWFFVCENATKSDIQVKTTLIRFLFMYFHWDGRIVSSFLSVSNGEDKNAKFLLSALQFYYHILVKYNRYQERNTSDYLFFFNRKFSQLYYKYSLFSRQEMLQRTAKGDEIINESFTNIGLSTSRWRKFLNEKRKQY